MARSRQLLCTLVLGVSVAAAVGRAAPAAVVPTVEASAVRGELPTAWGTAYGDLDAMRKWRVVRALVVPGRIGYFVQQGRQHGATYEALVALEQHLNRGRKKGELPVRVAIVPSSPTRIADDLLAGKGDVIAAPIAVTPARAQKVEFVGHIAEGLELVAVTRDDALAPASLEAIAGGEAWFIARSSALEEVQALNARWRKAGKPTITVRIAPEDLTDDDLLELVDAGILPLVFVHAYKVQFWQPVLKRLFRHDRVVLAADQQVAWAIRKDSPLLKQELDAFWRKNRVGTKLGNILVERYVKGSRYLLDPTTVAERRKYEQLLELFRTRSQQYHMDPLLMLAQGYQESRLEQARRSAAGAIGVMQLMPATGRSMEVGDITKLEPNVHAGVKYMRWIIDEYFDEPGLREVDRVLFAFAAYNAGPSRIRQMRAEAKRRELDPDRWFRNVEVVTAQRVGREPVDYVANIYKYYLAYSLMAEHDARIQAAKSAAGRTGGAR